MVLNKNSNEDLEKYFREAVKTIFALMAAMVIAAGIWSCRSIKNTAESESTMVKTERIDLSDVSKVQANRQTVDSAWISRVLTWNRAVKAVVYDTGKPIDSITGKRPVLVEITSNEEKTDSLQRKSVGKTDELMQMRDSMTAVVCDSTNKKTTEKMIMTKGHISFELMSSLILFGMIIGLAIWAGAIWWIRK